MIMAVHSLTVLMLLLGSYLYFPGAKRRSKIGYKGLSYYLFGKRIWKISNKTCGLLLIVGSVFFFYRLVLQEQHVTRLEATRYFYWQLLYLLLVVLMTETVAFMKIYFQKKGKGKMKSF